MKKRVKIEVVAREDSLHTCACSYDCSVNYQKNETTQTPLESAPSGLRPVFVLSAPSIWEGEFPISDVTPIWSTCLSLFANVRVHGASTQTPFQADRPAAVLGYARRAAWVGPSVPRRRASARLNKNDKVFPPHAARVGGSRIMSVEYSADEGREESGR